MTTEDKIAKKMFNVSKVTIYKWKKSGLLPYYKMNSRVYFKKPEVIDSLKKKVSSRLLDDYMLENINNTYCKKKFYVTLTFGVK